MTIRTKPTDRATDIAVYHAQLAAAFASRRCSCGAPATVIAVAPGEETLTEFGIVLRHGKPDRNLCLHCAGLEQPVDASVDRSTA